jgi:hypothetical protein
MNKKQFKQITSFEDACQVLGIDTKLPDVSTFPEDMQKQIIAFYKLSIISKAISQEWVADFTNHDQYRWFPVFYIEKSESGKAGVAARYSSNDLGLALSHYVSRLCYETEEISDYMADAFEDLYLDYLLG